MICSCWELRIFALSMSRVQTLTKRISQKTFKRAIFGVRFSGGFFPLPEHKQNQLRRFHRASHYELIIGRILLYSEIEKMTFETVFDVWHDSKKMSLI